MSTTYDRYNDPTRAGQVTNTELSIFILSNLKPGFFIKQFRTPDNTECIVEYTPTGITLSAGSNKRMIKKLQQMINNNRIEAYFEKEYQIGLLGTQKSNR